MIYYTRCKSKNVVILWRCDDCHRHALHTHTDTHCTLMSIAGGKRERERERERRFIDNQEVTEGR